MEPKGRVRSNEAHGVVINHAHNSRSSSGLRIVIALTRISLLVELGQHALKSLTLLTADELSRREKGREERQRKAQRG